MFGQPANYVTYKNYKYIFISLFLTIDIFIIDTVKLIRKIR